MSVIECVSYDTAYHGLGSCRKQFGPGFRNGNASARSFIEAAHRALAYASCVDIGNFKEVSGRPSAVFPCFAANGQALQGVHQIIVRSGKRRSRKKPFTDHNYRSIIPDMPHASRRYTSVRRRSDRASAGIWVFEGLSRSLNAQAPGRESQFRTPDPILSLN